MEVFGPPEKHLVERCSRKKLFFDSLGKPRIQVNQKGKRHRPSSKDLAVALKTNDEAFNDFIRRCLRWDPDRRMKPDEAIRHEYITGQKSSMAPVRANRDESPIKRHNTVATPAGNNRPLPEPPVTAFKSMAINPRGRTTTSPSKTAAGAGATAATARRVSNANGLNASASNISLGNRRTSTGPGVAAGGSGLPRVTRSVSARQDLASAGATAAMNKRVLDEKDGRKL
jgi:dual specificity tyrosine-phosphorylation-regulated kinase 2/3/4